MIQRCLRILPGRGFVQATGIALSLGFAGGAAATEQGVDPEADRILRAMSSYLGGLAAFSVQADVDDEIIDLAGQKLQMSSSASLLVERPDHFHAHRRGPAADLEVLFDGQTLTLHGKRLQIYARVDAPGTIEQAVTELRAATGFDAPAGDLLYADPYPGLMTDVSAGAYLGTAYVDGTEAHHLAFRATKVDWQIWVRTGDAPLPLKYVITSKWVTGAPQYAVRFRDWDTAPKIPADRFTFVAPEGARQLERLSVDDLGTLMIEETP
ncbi:DUF2092 domain-containing protein [Thiocapsa marina]|uniref:Periplasmic protein n=1 Tax=Thiocapsa marina 5811 TaxID=768671 RepID=F9UEE9_9GAMM|nr:DUF2092 domain-containing protein [Thiocapsa marina]EGV17270.1 Protein of unknown function DUF2092, periplasmic [Thiocapsa marina 5811]